MDEEFKKPYPIGRNHNNLLSAPEPLFAGYGKKDKSAKPHAEYVQMIQNNKDPLCREGKPFQNFTLEEVSHHSSAGDAWIIVNDKVYDITLYIDYHPGGRILLTAAGKDGTHLFMRYHPWVSIESLIGKLQIGNIISYASK